MHPRETCHHQRDNDQLQPLSLITFLSISSFKIQSKAARFRHWHLKPAATADKIYGTEQTVKIWGRSKRGYGTPGEPHIARLRSSSFSSSFESGKRKFTRYRPRLSRAYLDKIYLFLEGEPSIVTHQTSSLYGSESVVDHSLQRTTWWAYSAAFYGIACLRDECGLLRNRLLNLRVCCRRPVFAPSRTKKPS